jgi:hypothetical protein
MVVKCIETRTPVYLVKDDHGEILEWTFYAEELQKVIKTDDVYKIEPILKKRKKGGRVQYLVKWLGYQESFNSWIFKQDLQKRGVAVWSASLANGTEWHGQCNGLGDLWKEDSTFGGLILCQVLILYTVIVVSIYNLTVESENSTLWTALLSSCLGYLLPNPTIKTKHVLPDFA